MDILTDIMLGESPNDSSPRSTTSTVVKVNTIPRCVFDMALMSTTMKCITKDKYQTKNITNRKSPTEKK